MVLLSTLGCGGSPNWTRTKRIVRQNVDKQLGGVYFLVEELKKTDYAG